MVFVLLVSGRIPGVFASGPWQLGWGNNESTGYYGVGSNQMVVGSLPSNDSFWDEIIMNEALNSDQLDMSTGSNNGGNVYVAMEVLPTVGNSVHMTLCSGLDAGVYNTDKIVWNPSSEVWTFTSTCGGPGTSYAESTASDSVQAGDKDWVESYTFSTTHWGSMNAYTKCEYCMLYWTGAQWDTPVHVSSYYTGTPLPPSNLGVDYGCTGTNEPWDIMGSNYGGLWSYGTYPSPVCS
jgi:hypothetical protein